LGGFDEVVLRLLADDVHAELDALVADEHRRAGDQLADLVLALAAERAVEGVLAVRAAGLAHVTSPGGPSPPYVSRAKTLRHTLSNFAMTPGAEARILRCSG